MGWIKLSYSTLLLESEYLSILISESRMTSLHCVGCAECVRLTLCVCLREKTVWWYKHWMNAWMCFWKNKCRLYEVPHSRRGLEAFSFKAASLRDVFKCSHTKWLCGCVVILPLEQDINPYFLLNVLIVIIQYMFLWCTMCCFHYLNTAQTC